jgi:hypothetical protein
MSCIVPVTAVRNIDLAARSIPGHGQEDFDAANIENLVQGVAGAGAVDKHGYEDAFVMPSSTDILTETGAVAIGLQFVCSGRFITTVATGRTVSPSGIETTRATYWNGMYIHGDGDFNTNRIDDGHRNAVNNGQLDIAQTGESTVTQVGQFDHRSCMIFMCTLGDGAHAAGVVPVGALLGKPRTLQPDALSHTCVTVTGPTLKIIGAMLSASHLSCSIYKSVLHTPTASQLSMWVVQDPLHPSQAHLCALCSLFVLATLAVLNLYRRVSGTSGLTDHPGGRPPVRPNVNNGLRLPSVMYTVDTGKLTTTTEVTVIRRIFFF